jgi:hypothetical protein
VQKESPQQRAPGDPAGQPIRDSRRPKTRTFHGLPSNPRPGPGRERRKKEEEHKEEREKRRKERKK